MLDDERRRERKSGSTKTNPPPGSFVGGGQGGFGGDADAWTGAEEDCACPDFFEIDGWHMLLLAPARLPVLLVPRQAHERRPRWPGADLRDGGEICQTTAAKFSSDASSTANQELQITLSHKWIEPSSHPPTHSRSRLVADLLRRRVLFSHSLAANVCSIPRLGSL